MKLRVRAELVYRFDPPTDAIYKIQVAHWPGQDILHESLTFDPPVEAHEDEDVDFGARTLRCHVSGEVRLTYEAVVENGVLKGLPPDVSQHDWGDLPAEVLPYLQPSRYCPSDQFGRFVTREFGDTSGGARVLAILNWITANIDYERGVSDTETTAARTFIDRAGVCRDFTHLGMTLCRASGIPARAVSAYAFELSPPDFHAIFEVWLDNGWWLVDATGLAPVEGLVRIACGRDAADIAFLTTQERCAFVRQSVTVEAA
ncbi:transglutaminase-like putative cysteine protease [Brevundimonas nasdae]|jgi:transglutaminase-like putative cysteine protease|uniref:Transglutaminase family protein n=1 Tax=Brevundimonas nasdae TaxID=172043 RepID=A0ABX8TDU0_9CAUL|nr:transglutaminase family protein [Brevundimonas nasdae]MBK6023494.1 transglutaminase family protein [Brevundimonas nasdae]MDQ0450143.1 transglutaminase-like putative cysteine protease [Brevundimonas nasdae]QYC09361.1 transglutaminase family protein [Brevundimonas nasdae]QYC15409.1 transglutaminase family protein [Brevundimonas nasdae]